jgi:hemoglobin-like flavoprotein
MTQEQVRLVQASLPAILDMREVAAALFYKRLFDIDPSTRPLFAGVNMAKQGTKLMSALGMIVGALSRLETFRPTIRDLARRHVHYGVRPHHYDSVGAALLWTLERGLADAFTPELKTAWAAAYAVLSETMRDGVGETIAA